MTTLATETRTPQPWTFQNRYAALLSSYGETGVYERLGWLLRHRAQLWQRLNEESQAADNARYESDYFRHSDYANLLEGDVIAADWECERALRQLEQQPELRAQPTHVMRSSGKAAA